MGLGLDGKVGGLAYSGVQMDGSWGMPQQVVASWGLGKGIAGAVVRAPKDRGQVINQARGGAVGGRRLGLGLPPPTAALCYAAGRATRGEVGQSHSEP